MYNITVVGAGYVGLSTAILFAQRHLTTVLDIVDSIADGINSGEPHLKEFEGAFNEELKLRATTDTKAAYERCDYAIIAVPTNYDEETKQFDVSVLDDALSKVNDDAIIIIKSTVPIGYTEKAISQYGERVVFSPEFLREGNALYDLAHPSRVIVGAKDENIAEAVKDLLLDICENNPPYELMTPTEAEAVKLFSNTYLAMRVAFFNELDAYAEKHSLRTGKIINGVCLDPRIGSGYNNPSFGYGGYCLPKDSKQLAYQLDSEPSQLIKSIPKSNEARFQAIADAVSDKETIGVYGLAMKAGSRNMRSSAVIEVIRRLQKMNKNVIVYDEIINSDGLPMVSTLEELERADIILLNRVSDTRINGKIYTRDVFGNE